MSAIQSLLRVMTLRDAEAIILETDGLSVEQVVGLMLIEVNKTLQMNQSARV